MFRFAVKVGVASAAVYYLKEEGIWKESSVSLAAYDKINTAIRPYVTQAKELIPLELPQIPPTDSIFSSAQQYWNLGVMTSFQFLSDLPHKANAWTESAITALKQNPDIQRILQSEPPTEAKSRDESKKK